MKLPEQVSESVKKRNPHLFNQRDYVGKVDFIVGEPKKQRVRQSAKPLMNKLEREWWDILRAEFPDSQIVAQSVKFKIANGCWLTADFVVFHADGSAAIYETKGKHAWDDSLVKLKVVAANFPRVKVWLVWKDHEKWQRQRILE